MMDLACNIQEDVRRQLEEALQGRTKRINSEKAEEERKRRARKSFLQASRRCVESVIEPSLRALEEFLRTRKQVISLDMKAREIGDRLICEVTISGEEPWASFEFLQDPHLRFEFCSLDKRVRYCRKAKKKDPPATEIHLHGLTRHLVEREMAFAIQSLLD